MYEIQLSVTERYLQYMSQKSTKQKWATAKIL